jgi:hypothetical protein
MRPPTGDGPPPQFDPQTSMINFSNDQLIAKLREEAQHGDLEFATRSLVCDASGTVPRVALTYQTTQPDDSLTMYLMLLRSEAFGAWLIDSWRLEGETEHDHSHHHSHTH